MYLALDKKRLLNALNGNGVVWVGRRGGAVPGQAPQDEAQTAVGVQADGDLAGGVELTLQLDGAAEGADGHVGDLRGREHQGS